MHFTFTENLLLTQFKQFNCNCLCSHVIITNYRRKKVVHTNTQTTSQVLLIKQLLSS